MALYVVEESRNGRKQVYRGGQLTPYEKRRPQAHGYATARAAKAAAERLNLQIAFDIYNHRAIEGDRYYEENYKEYYVEDDQTHEREGYKMKLRDVVNRLNNVDVISIAGLCDEYYDGVDELKKEDWYKRARDRRVTDISVLVNGHMRTERQGWQRA